MPITSSLVVAIAGVDPLLAHDLKHPFIPLEVFNFVERELAKFHLTWDALWFPGPVTMQIARQAVNNIRAKYGLGPLLENVA